MRKIYFLMLLFTGITGFAFSPPVIQTPTSVTICQGAIFSLHGKDTEILGALNPGLYTVNYYLSNADADSNVNAIPNPDTFISNFTQMIFVRVEDNANPTVDYSLTNFVMAVEPMPTGMIVNLNETICQYDASQITFQGSGGIAPYIFVYSINGGANQTITSGVSGSATVILPQIAAGMFVVVLTDVYSSSGGGCPGFVSNNMVQIDVVPSPTIGIPQDLSVEDIPFDGTAVFDLTSNDALLINGQTGVTVSYYTTLVDAQNATNQISNEAAFTGTNGQMIWGRVDNGSCGLIQSFRLFVTNPNIVFIPDPIFKNYLVNHNPTIDLNANSEIEYSEAAAYNNLFLIGNMNISDLTGVEAFVNLTELHCYNNNLTSLDVSGLTNLILLYCFNNQLTTLNISGDTSLTTIDCYNNQLTSLDVTGFNNLYEFYCNNNLLTTLNLSGTTNLADLKCHNNQLTSLDVSDSVNLISLGCSGNPLSALDVSNLVNLQYLFCYETLLTTLDVSNCTSLFNLVFNNNPNLTSVYMKNGRDEGLNLSNNPNLEFICADDSQLANVQQLLTTAGLVNAVVNSYCSFIPGGNHNTVTGTLTFDSDNNGCDAFDATQANVKVKFASPIELGATFTNANGIYTFYADAGSFNWLPDFENPTWFTISPTSGSTIFANNNNNTATQNFCITANSVHPDLEVVIAPIVPARPGFDAVYKIVYKNVGNQVMTQQYGISFFYNNNLMSFVSANTATSSVGVGSMTWDYANLQPFESRSITVTLHINPPTDLTNPVNIGDVLTFTTNILPALADENTQNNTFQYNQTVVGSYDPNDITCIQGDVVPPSQIGNYLHYIINFENTGNADAINIVVKDVIDINKFDVSTLQILNSSDPVTANIKDNTAEFVFQNINLHSGGHGNILLKIKTKATLVEGDIASKRADIFFDYNFPIDTGFANTTFQALNNHHFDLDNSISVYPNPTKDNVTIKGNFTFKSVQLYDIQGRVLQTKILDGNNVVLDLSSQQAGIYFVKVVSDKGIKVEKISKE